MNNEALLAKSRALLDVATVEARRKLSDAPTTPSGISAGFTPERADSHSTLNSSQASRALPAPAAAPWCRLMPSAPYRSYSRLASGSESTSAKD